MQKKNVFLWLGVICIVALCFFGWPLFRNAFIQWTLREYCRTTLGCTLSYEQFSYDSSSGAHLEGIALRPLGQKDALLEARSATVNFQLLALKRVLRSRIQVEEPRWELGAWHRNWAKRYKGRRLIFRPEWLLEANGGVVTSQGKEIGGLDVELRLQQVASGLLKWHFGEQVLVAEWKENQEETEVVCAGEHLSPDWIWPIFVHLEPSLGVVALGQGDCSGRLALNYQKEGWSLQEAHIEGSLQELTVIPSLQTVDQVTFSLAAQKGEWLSPSFVHGYIGPVEGRVEGAGNKIQFALQSDWQALFTEWKGLRALSKVILPLPLSIHGEANWGEDIIHIQGKGESGKIEIPFQTTFSWSEGRLMEGNAEMAQANLFSFWNPSFMKMEGDVSVEASWNGSGIHVRLYPVGWKATTSRFEWTLLSVGNWEWKLDRGTGFSEGTGEIKGSSFLDQETHLGTDDLSGQLILRPDGELLVHVETEVEGILVQGEAEIKEGNFVVEDPWIEGDLGDVKKVLLAYIPLQEWSPLFPGGRLISRSSKTEWSKESGFKTQGEGELQGGQWSHPLAQLIDFHADFRWDNQLGKISFSKGEGVWQMEASSPLHLVVDEWSYSWNHPQVQADFWLSDRRKDVLRVAGSAAKEGEEWALALIPEKTHWGPITVKEFDVRGKYHPEEQQWIGAVNNFQLQVGPKTSLVKAEGGKWSFTPSPLEGEVQLLLKNKKEWIIRYSEEKGWELPKWEW